MKDSAILQDKSVQNQEYKGYLIDWITARLPYDKFTDREWQQLQNQSDRIIRFDPLTGNQVYDISAWDSVRSDSHAVVYRVGGDALWIQGSPARAVGDGCTVFGSGPSASLDLASCVRRMAQLVGQQVELPLIEKNVFDWIVTRVDVTGNLMLDDLAAVKVALSTLRNCEGGRYRVSQQAGDTVYWSHSSRYKSGKAYAKGPHLAYMNKKNKTDYPPEKIQSANRLLRLELSLKRDYFQKIAWEKLKPLHLVDEWKTFFMRMIGAADMTHDSQLMDKLRSISPTEGQAKAAYQLWALIKSEGWQSAREIYSKSTWYRSLKLLRNAGLSDTDISTGQIVPLRRKVIAAQLATSWEHLLMVG